MNNITEGTAYTARCVPEAKLRNTSTGRCVSDIKRLFPHLELL